MIKNYCAFQKCLLCVIQKDLKINGNSLQKIGIPKGKMIGYILQELFKTVLDDPTQNTEIKLLEIAKKIYQNILQG
ncbi:MAG: hypothetical protein IKI31_07605 [Treponema sp.]|nr:hypothetical protein [Treponema sp.]